MKKYWKKKMDENRLMIIDFYYIFHFYRVFTNFH